MVPKLLGDTGPGPRSFLHSPQGLVFIMSFLHINLDRGSPGFPGSRTQIPFLSQSLMEIGNHNVLPPQEGEEITFRTRNHQIDLIIRSCLKIYTTQVLYKGLDIIVIMAFLS